MDNYFMLKISIMVFLTTVVLTILTILWIDMRFRRKRLLDVFHKGPIKVEIYRTFYILQRKPCRISTYMGYLVIGEKTRLYDSLNNKLVIELDRSDLSFGATCCLGYCKSVIPDKGIKMLVKRRVITEKQ